jgi:hypothetical protein
VCCAEAFAPRLHPGIQHLLQVLTAAKRRSGRHLKGRQASQHMLYLRPTPSRRPMSRAARAAMSAAECCLIRGCAGAAAVSFVLTILRPPASAWEESALLHTITHVTKKHSHQAPLPLPRAPRGEVRTKPQHEPGLLTVRSQRAGNDSSNVQLTQIKERRQRPWSCSLTWLAGGTAAGEAGGQQAVDEAAPPRRHLLVLLGDMEAAEGALGHVHPHRAPQPILQRIPPPSGSSCHMTAAPAQAVSAAPLYVLMNMRIPSYWKVGSQWSGRTSPCECCGTSQSLLRSRCASAAQDQSVSAMAVRLLAAPAGSGAHRHADEPQGRHCPLSLVHRRPDACAVVKSEGFGTVRQRHQQAPCRPRPPAGSPVTAGDAHRELPQTETASLTLLQHDNMLVVGGTALHLLVRGSEGVARAGAHRWGRDAPLRSDNTHSE